MTEQANRVTTSAFLVALVEAVPNRIHTVPTDNREAISRRDVSEADKGIQFRLPPRYVNGSTARYLTHMFDRRCGEFGIKHRFTRINHPWSNGQVERMNRTIKEDTVHRYHCDDHDQLRRHLEQFVQAYNFSRRLNTRKGLTLYKPICRAWQNEPKRFTTSPLPPVPTPNT